MIFHFFIYKINIELTILVTRYFDFDLGSGDYRMRMELTDTCIDFVGVDIVPKSCSHQSCFHQIYIMHEPN